MSAQAILKQEERRSSQEDFHGLITTPNGGGVRLPPGEEHVASESLAAPETPLADAIGEQATEREVEIEGALVASTRLVELKVPMTCRAEVSPSDSLTVSYFDRAETISLQIVFDEQLVHINTQYTDKPLEAALTSARFFQALMTMPGRLLFEVSVSVEGGEPTSILWEVGALPIPLPEPKLEEYRDRLRLLEALYEIMVNTGVEIGYPANTRDEGQLSNLNFVLKAIRGGWVASSVTDFSTHVSAAEVRTLLEELQQEGQVGRAFFFEIPNEAYEVFGKEVNLGPSRRYLAAARLTTSRGEMESWLNENPEDQDSFGLRWEPMDDAPMHVFFENWPKSSLASVERELREFEAVYRVSSERFKQAWEQGEAWIEEIQDGNRWFSLVQAREELMQES